MSPATTPLKRDTRKQSRPARVAEAIRAWVMREGLEAGARLPSEAELMESFGMAKGTIREAMRILEAQGLIRTRTGPGGGAFVHEMSVERAQALLSNFFYFKDLTIRDIYQVRMVLEPEMVARVAGRLTGKQLAELRAVMDGYGEPATTPEEERDQHIASLSFHQALARMSDNPLLGFLIGFIARALSDLTIYRQLYDPPNRALWQSGRDHQADLLVALEQGQADSARAIMHDHMRNAWQAMEAQQDDVVRNLLSD